MLPSMSLKPLPVSTFQARRTVLGLVMETQKFSIPKQQLRRFDRLWPLVWYPSFRLCSMKTELLDMLDWQKLDGTHHRSLWLGNLPKETAGVNSDGKLASPSLSFHV